MQRSSLLLSDRVVSWLPVVEGSESMDHLILDVSNGEFPCPYCKSISNSLVPFIPPHAASSCTASSQPSPRAAPPACQSSGSSSVMDVSPERPARPDLASPPPPPSTDQQQGPCSKLQAALTRLLQGGASGADKMMAEEEEQVRE